MWSIYLNNFAIHRNAAHHVSCSQIFVRFTCYIHWLLTKSCSFLLLFLLLIFIYFVIFTLGERSHFWLVSTVPVIKSWDYFWTIVCISDQIYVLPINVDFNVNITCMFELPEEWHVMFYAHMNCQKCTIISHIFIHNGTMHFGGSSRHERLMDPAIQWSVNCVEKS